MTTTQTRPDATHRARPVRRRVLTRPRILVAVALTLWLLNLPALSAAPTHPFGLLFAAGPWFAIATGLVIAGFIVAVRRGALVDMVVTLAAYIVIVRVPVSALTEVPIYSWTYKHLGVIDYLANNGAVANGVDIYSGWPGFFAAVAWFTSLSGIAPIDFAHWFTVGYHFAVALAVYALARAFGQVTRTALVAAFIAELVNWVGQDYLAPQSLAFLLAIVVLALLVRSRQYPVAGWLSLPLFAAITVSHQLTPFWLLGIAIVLGITGHIRPRFIGAAFGVVALGHLVLNLSAVGNQSLLTGLDPVANALGRDTGGGSPGHDFSSFADHAVSLGLWGAAALVIVVSVIRNRRILGPVWMAGVLAFSAFVLLAGQNYGGEAVFRVFLYSIPGCAILLAPPLIALLTRSHRTFIAGLVVVMLMGLGALEAYYGGWFANLITKSDYETSARLYETAPVPTTFILAAPGGAGRSTDAYVPLARAQRQFEYSLTDWKDWRGNPLTTSRMFNNLTRDLLGAPTPSTIILSKQIENYSDYYGLYPPGALNRLLDQLRSSEHWEPVEDNDSIHVFRLLRT